jgi:hypothetical protein
MKTVEAQGTPETKEFRKSPPEVGDSAMRGEAGNFLGWRASQNSERAESA